MDKMRADFEAWWTGRTGSDDLEAKAFGFEIWTAALASSATTDPSDLNKAILALPLPEHVGRVESQNETGSLVTVWMNRNYGLPYDTKVYTEDQMRALLSAAAALAKQVPAQEQDTKKIAESVASMVIDWIEDGKRVCGENSDWKTGLPNIIERRLNRFLKSAAQLAQSADKAEG